VVTDAIWIIQCTEHNHRSFNIDYKSFLGKFLLYLWHIIVKPKRPSWDTF